MEVDRQIIAGLAWQKNHVKDPIFIFLNVAVVLFSAGLEEIQFCCWTIAKGPFIKGWEKCIQMDLLSFVQGKALGHNRWFATRKQGLVEDDRIDITTGRVVIFNRFLEKISYTQPAP